MPRRLASLIPRPARRLLAAPALALGGAHAGGCTPQPERPLGPAEAPVAATPVGQDVGGIPDTVVRSPGLPPRVTDSTTRALGPAGDTLVLTQVMVFPAYSVPAGQVAPGAPTAGPMRVSVRVLARDTAQSVLRMLALPLAACPVVLELSRADGGAPVWRSSAAPGATACPPVQRYTFGDAGEANVAWPAPALLGDSLPAGRYALRATVRLADGRALDYPAVGAYLTADPTPPVRDFGALRLTAESRVEGGGPRVLRTAAWVRNPTTRSLRFEYGACALRQRLYRSAARTGTAAWRSELRRPAGSPGGYACPAVLLGSTLPPGDSLRFGLAVPLAEVLGDSLPAGRYFVAAELELLDDSQRPPNWERRFTLAAGEAELDRSRDALPASRTVDGLRYDAATRLVGDTVRTLVMVTNTTAAARQAEVPGECPVIAYGYRSAARRDSVPLVEPAWRSARPCRLTPHRFALAPGAAWVFAHDAPAAALRAGLGAGRVWFTAWVAGRHDVKLAAGDVELR